MGRAARNVDGQVILYADRSTGSMQRAIDETTRRRAKQQAYNDVHGIVPKTAHRSLQTFRAGDGAESQQSSTAAPEHIELDKLPKELDKLRKKMLDHAEALEFEQAAELRDQIRLLEEQLLRLT